MNLAVENPREYFKQFQQMDKLVKFGTFVESLRREDDSVNKALINTLMEGIQVIIEGKVDYKVVSSFINNAKKNTNSKLNASSSEGHSNYTAEERNADPSFAKIYGNNGMNNSVGEFKVMDTKGKMALREYKKALDAGDETRATKMLKTATDIFIAIAAPSVAKALNVYQDSFSNEQLTDAFAEIIHEIAKRVSSGDPEITMPYYNKYVAPLLKINLVPRALGKAADFKIIKQWLPNKVYSKKGNRVYYEGKFYELTNTLPINLAEQKKGTPPIDLDDVISDDWKEITPPKGLYLKQNGAGVNEYDEEAANSDSAFGTTSIDDDAQLAPISRARNIGQTVEREDEVKWHAMGEFAGLDDKEGLNDEIDMLKKKLNTTLNVGEKQSTIKEIKRLQNKLDKIDAKYGILSDMSEKAEKLHQLQADLKYAAKNGDKQLSDETKQKINDIRKNETRDAITKKHGMTGGRRDALKVEDDMIDYLTDRFGIDPDVAKKTLRGNKEKATA